MIVRYFAGAAEAAGRREQPVSGTLTVADLKSRLAAEHGPEFARVLGLCSILLDGARAADDAVAAETSTVDILPPFAGG